MSETTILIVEDQYDNRIIYREALRHAGYRVLEAVNGEDGLRLAQDAAPDLILMDLSMPVLDGWSAVARLKKDPLTCNIPVIALSAHVVMGGDCRRAQQAGFET